MAKYICIWCLLGNLIRFGHIASVITTQPGFITHIGYINALLNVDILFSGSSCISAQEHIRQAACKRLHSSDF